MNVKILYPHDKSKVSCPDVKFRWTPVSTKNRYLITLFKLEKSLAGGKGTIGKDKDEIVGDVANWRELWSEETNKSEITRRLRPGGVYHVTVTQIKSIKGIIPGRRRLSIDSSVRNIPFDKVPDSPVFREQDWALKSVGHTFMVKRESNYLKKYFEIKARGLKKYQHLKPMIPLLFGSLERYLKLQRYPDAFEITPCDEAFEKALIKLPDDMRSISALERVLGFYQDSELDETKRKLFGDRYVDHETSEWCEEAIGDLFSGTWIEELKGKVEKKLAIEVKRNDDFPELRKKYLPIDEMELRINLTDIVSDTEIGKLKVGDKYTFVLEISGSDDYVIPLEVREENGKTFFYSDDVDLSELDSAPYILNIYEGTVVETGDLSGLSQIAKGYLFIKGGLPVILKVDPESTSTTNPTDVCISVRDGGKGEKVILKKEADGSTKSIPFKSSNQFGTKQEFIFSSANLTHGEYSVQFVNSDNVVSVNRGSLFIQTHLFSVRVSKIKCLDVSNPEWWDDTISFQTFVNTSRFVQYPHHSKTYGGFNDNVEKTIDEEDGLIYAPGYENNRRIIEDSLNISVSIYEHDNLDWLESAINYIVDYVQDYLAHLTDAFTCGLGGFIILAALEISGLNDMREEAIDSLVSGWEIELLHVNKTKFIPPNINNVSSLHMGWPEDESEYQVWFKVESHTIQ